MANSTAQDVYLVQITMVQQTFEVCKSPLGVVIMEQSMWENARLTTLRDKMMEQMPSRLPKDFIFCTKSMHGLTKGQEVNVKCHQIADDNREVYIRHMYAFPKTLIKEAVCESLVLGHVFCPYSTTLKELREIMTREIPNIIRPATTYQFMSCDNIPISLREERQMGMSEVVLGQSVRIQYLNQDAESSSSKRKSETSLEHSRGKALRLSFSSSKDVTRPIKDEPIVPAAEVMDSKQLLISYVRAEAAEHALNLKGKLTDLGFSVYLDVHEIKSGIDWQDALNYAVSNCQVFIPLVTPRYGETQWTNREVKLADVLGKPILPISFLNEWPPKCLAIQFATTQFIFWKSPQRPEKDDCPDIRVWESSFMDSVVSELALRVKAIKFNCVSLSKPALTRMKTLMKTFTGRLPKSVAPVLSTQDSEEPMGSSVVICSHPNEAGFGFKLKGWLESIGHSVWLSSVKDCKSFDTGILSVCLQKALHPNKFVEKDRVPDEHYSSVAVRKYVQQFQENVDKAHLVIAVLSEGFTGSKTCKQQLFYCEHRKQILAVKYRDFSFPCWLSMLIRMQRVMDAQKPTFHKTFLMSVQRLLDPTARNCLEPENHEANINVAVQYLKRSLHIQKCVYIAASSNLKDSRSEPICKAIALQLAKLPDVVVVTGGSKGASEILSHTFHQEVLDHKKKPHVWHVLPERDAEDVSDLYAQCSDGTFTMMSFGKTLFCGGSINERESIVARCFPVCLLIDGGNSSCHEVQEFVWSDHIVVPVNCSSATLVGDLTVTDKLFQVPAGVLEDDWKHLNNKNTSVEDVGQVVARIVQSLLDHHQSEEESATQPNTPDAVSSTVELSEHEVRPHMKQESPPITGPPTPVKLRSLHTMKINPL
ncbi:uncharacterized protein LOC101852907 [Aplysia californica]|uniref:Uncharacterized protein LOC101852907 n=1 Tax=Aplysia californica TaxID=6500 RepID=A0ABM0JGZ2_APLCA|nr:uncharacterized protein LOC101852907 [Aplysia californica]